MLALGALIASLLAVGAGPAAGQPNSSNDPDHNPEFGANWSACVGAAGTHDAAFPDVSEDNVHADDINCLAYYAITIGMGDGTYAPDANVSAFEMELFVQRAADLMGADGEAVLTDVELSDTVTRLEMAKLMFGLVNDIDDGVRINNRSGEIEFRNDANAWVVVNDFFADAKARVPIADSQLVGATYELGITRGTKGDGTLVSTAGSTFEPFAPVTRAQMASFIIRTLDHSNARPEGLSVQRNFRSETQVSLRDGDFAPIEDARIDVFSAQYDVDAFDEDDGECELRFVRDETPSHDVCAIDIGDQLTDDQGNVEFTLVSDVSAVVAPCASDPTVSLDFTADTGSEARTHWAWTGSLDDEVDVDTVRAELEDVARPVGRAGPDYALVSGGLPTGDELAKMGELVTFTLQLKSEVGATRNHNKDIDAGPDRSRNPYVLRIEKYLLARHAVVDASTTPPTVTVTDSDAETNNGNANTDFSAAPGDWRYLNPNNPQDVTATAAQARIQTPFDTVVWPNQDGEYIINLSNDDLNAASDDPDVGVRFTLRPFTTGNDLLDANLVKDIDVTKPAPNFAESSTADRAPTATLGADTVTGHVIFSDDASDPHAVSAKSLQYRIISGSRTGNSWTVEVVDQYGDGMSNVEFWLNSDLDGTGDLSDSSGNRDSTITPDGADGSPSDLAAYNAGTSDDEAEDLVVYPEEIDRTVQAHEDAHRVDSTDGTNDRLPSVVDILNDPDDASPGQTSGDDVPGQIWIRRTAPTSHNSVLADHDGDTGTPDTLGRVTFADADATVTPAVVATAPTKSQVDTFFVDVSHRYWRVEDGEDNTVGTGDDVVWRREQVPGPFDTISSSIRALRTRRNGTYRVGYSYIGNSARTETVTPQVIGIESFGDNPATPDADATTDGAQLTVTVGGRTQTVSLLTYIIDQLRQDGTYSPTTSIETDFRLGTVQQPELGKAVSVYWAKEGNNVQSDTVTGGDPDRVPVLVRDVPNRAIVVNEPTTQAADATDPATDDDDNPMVYYYDEDDNFSIRGTGGVAAGVTFEMFEEALSATWKDNGIYVDMVEWENYTTSRPGRVSRTIWELSMSCTDPADRELSADGASWTAS